MQIGLFGHGKMGKAIENLAPLQGHQIVDPLLADVCIDFSHADVLLKHVQWAAAHQKPLIIGTTGWDSQLPAIKEIVESGGISALASPNFSIGVSLFIKILEKARSLLEGYELAGVEFHHNQKKDAPSGTAKKIADALHMEHPFSSVRCGTITGKHEVIFNSPFDSITLIHEAHTREAFAKGALQAAEWIQNRKGWFTLDDMLRSLYSARYPL